MKRKKNLKVEVEVEMRDRFYIEADPRRLQEKSDSRMVYEDHYAPANLYQKPIYHEFDADKYVEKFGKQSYEID